MVKQSIWQPLNLKQQMLGVLNATDEYFRQDNRWTENVMSALAGVCSRCQLWKRSTEYYSVAIMQRRRTVSASSDSDSTLS